MSPKTIQVLIASTLLVAAPAHAYIGPGAGLTAIGTVIALIGAVLLAIVGFVWYPVKRLRARLTKSRDKEDDEEREQRDPQEQDA